VVGEPRHLPAAVTAARQVPELRFVLDHLGNPDMTPGASPEASQPWASAFTQFAALENTTAKLSGILSVPPPPGAAPGTLAHIRPYYDFALHDFGPNRLMFGSDWPPSTLEASYPQVCAIARTLTADLSEPERAAIFSGTARRIYRLP
jgi:L-fuconolactonase